MENDLFDEVKKELSAIYAGKTSENRINMLAESLMGLITDPKAELKEVLYLLDDFEGGSCDKAAYDRILGFVARKTEELR